MVHFVEDSQGYAEKIYLDISSGDNPEHWDTLNSGQPILASHLGTTGVRDPYITYNPQTKTYYIIATDLRVFGGDSGSGSCTIWCYWSSQGSTKLNVWESKDLVNWSDLRQIDVTAGSDAQLGMAWAPEATWVPDFNGPGDGAFVVYWSSNIYDPSDTGHSGNTYSRVMWGSTTDFTAETMKFGGVFIDDGKNNIDTTIIQNDGTTYRVTKDNGWGKGLYMDSTRDSHWWEPGTTWTRVQEKIGASWANGNPGGVEGPAIFKDHNRDLWYLYVDVIPTTGYKPMVTSNLDQGWRVLDSPTFYMRNSTKHGGIISLTKGQYDTIRQADAVSVTQENLGSVEITAGASADEARDALASKAEATLSYGMGTNSFPIEWDLSGVDFGTAQPGDAIEVHGKLVGTIGANLNDWRQDADSKTPISTTQLGVTVELKIVEGSDNEPTDEPKPTATPSPSADGNQQAKQPRTPRRLPKTGVGTSCYLSASFLAPLGEKLSRLSVGVVNEFWRAA